MKIVWEVKAKTIQELRAMVEEFKPKVGKKSVFNIKNRPSCVSKLIVVILSNYLNMINKYAYISKYNNLSIPKRGLFLKILLFFNLSEQRYFV